MGRRSLYVCLSFILHITRTVTLDAAPDALLALCMRRRIHQWSMVEIYGRSSVVCQAPDPCRSADKCAKAMGEQAKEAKRAKKSRNYVCDLVEKQTNCLVNVSRCATPDRIEQATLIKANWANPSGGCGFALHQHVYDYYKAIRARARSGPSTAGYTSPATATAPGSGRPCPEGTGGIPPPPSGYPGGYSYGGDIPPPPSGYEYDYGGDYNNDCSTPTRGITSPMSTRDVGPPGSTPDIRPPGSTPDIGPAGSTPDIGPAGSTPDIGPDITDAPEPVTETGTCHSKSGVTFVASFVSLMCVLSM